MQDDYTLKLTTLFIEFLQAFASASIEERSAFLDFIKPQERTDLLALAEALRAKAAQDEKD